MKKLEGAKEENETKMRGRAKIRKREEKQMRARKRGEKPHRERLSTRGLEEFRDVRVLDIEIRILTCARYHEKMLIFVSDGRMYS